MSRKREKTGRLDRKLWLFEHIGMDPLSNLFVLLALVTGGVIRYAGIHPRALSLWRRWAPAARLDEIYSPFTLEAATHLRIYDLVEERTAEIERAVTFRRLRRFFEHPKLAIIVRKALVADGFGALMLCLETEHRLNAGESVSLLPHGFRPYVMDRYPAARRRIPPLWRMKMWTGSWIDRLLRPACFGVRTLWVMARNGVKRRLGEPRKWKICQIVTGDLSTRGRIVDGLLYDGDGFAPEQILHWVRDKPSREYLDYARTRSIPVVWPGALQSTPGFIFRRVLRGYVLQVLTGAIVDCVVNRVAQDLEKVIVRMGFDILESERFALHHQPRVCFAWDAYWARADVRSIVLEQFGGRYVGYMHGSPWLPLNVYHNTCVPVLLCAGAGIRDMFGKTLRHVEEVIPVGLMPTELTLDPALDPQGLRSQAKGQHIVAVFDSSFSPFWGLTREVFEIFYRGILAIVQKWPGVTVYLKRKYGPGENPVYDSLAAEMEGQSRLHVTYDENTYRLLAGADSVVVITSSTVGWEALACRKPAFFFDPRPQYQGNPAWKYGPPLVCHTERQLLDGFGEMLDGRYMDQKKWDRIVDYEARFADERPLTRARRVLLREAEVGRKEPGGKKTPCLRQ